MCVVTGGESYVDSPCQRGTRGECWEVRAAALPSDQVFHRWTAVIHLPQINTANLAHTRLGEGRPGYGARRGRAWVKG